MKKRKNNKTSKLDYNKIWKIWPIIAIIILLLLFALAFSVAPDWNNKKISINYNIDKIITELEPLAQNDSRIANFINLVKTNKNFEISDNGLASYNPYNYFSSETCQKGWVQKDQICEGTSPPITIKYPCATCLDCTKIVTYNYPYRTYRFKVCDYKTGTDKKKCDNNCLYELPIPYTKYKNDRKCVQLVPSDTKTSCADSCIDSTGCGLCESCIVNLDSGIGTCTKIKDGKDDSGHGDPNNGGYASPGCSNGYLKGTLVNENYKCVNGNCIQML